MKPIISTSTLALSLALTVVTQPAHAASNPYGAYVPYEPKTDINRTELFYLEETHGLIGCLSQLTEPNPYRYISTETFSDAQSKALQRGLGPLMGMSESERVPWRAFFGPRVTRPAGQSTDKLEMGLWVWPEVPGTAMGRHAVFFSVSEKVLNESLIKGTMFGGPGPRYRVTFEIPKTKELFDVKLQAGLDQQRGTDAQSTLKSEFGFPYPKILPHRGFVFNQEGHVPYKGHESVAKPVVVSDEELRGSLREAVRSQLSKPQTMLAYFEAKRSSEADHLRARRRQLAEAQQKLNKIDSIKNFEELAPGRRDSISSEIVGLKEDIPRLTEKLKKTSVQRLSERYQECDRRVKTIYPTEFKEASAAMEQAGSIRHDQKRLRQSGAIGQ